MKTPADRELLRAWWWMFGIIGGAAVLLLGIYVATGCAPR